jgi:hypothetical protein
MNTEKFERLISSDEGRLLDFKREQYKLLNGNLNDLAKFVKDIISFANTIREEPAYIIIGIDENNGQKVFNGLNEHVDDAIFQDKIKDKVNPRPNFKYYSFLYDSKRFGIIEIPVEVYSAPLTVVKANLKGLEVGKVYFRRGSSNSEATGIEAININEWITSVIPSHSKLQINQTIASIISKINSSEYFSPHVSEALAIGKQVVNDDLIKYCVFELTGEHDVSYDLQYRLMDCFMSTSQVLQPNYPEGTPMSVLWNDMRKDDDFWESKINIGDAINHIESQLRNFKTGASSQFIRVERKEKHFIPDSKNPELPIHVYWGERSIGAVYERSKQRLVALLTRIIV